MQGEGPVAGDRVSAAELIKKTEEGRAALRGQLDPLFVKFWTDVLNMAFEWFPHEHGDGSQNERTFQAIRHRVLREGNKAKREAINLLDSFAIQQVFQRNVEYQAVKGQGPFNLPPGVRMPCERNKA